MAVVTSTSVKFAAMGTTGHLQIAGPGAKNLAKVGVSLVTALERRWSRFLPGSDVSRVNRTPGHSVEVDPSTIELLELALAAWVGTDRRFSPFLGRAMHDIGYSRSWTAGNVLTPKNNPLYLGDGYLADGYLGTNAGPDHPVSIDRDASAVTISQGVQLDFGGIAKGFAADLVFREVVRLGAVSALVDLGGDMAFGSVLRPGAGNPRPWTIAVDDPFNPGRSIDSLVADGGGVATSSTLRRRWRSETAESFHHLVDPATGRPVASDIAAVTVVADSCANAEVLTKQFLLMGRETAVCEATRLGVDALMVGHDHAVSRTGIWEQAVA